MGIEWGGKRRPRKKPPTPNRHEQAPEISGVFKDTPATDDMFIETPVDIDASVERVSKSAGELVVYTQLLPSTDSTDPNIRFAEQIRARRISNND